MFSLHYYSFFIVDLEDNAQKMKFSIKDFFSKCDEIRSFVQIWSHLLEKSLMENLILVKWESQKSIKVFIIDWIIHCFTYWVWASILPAGFAVYLFTRVCPASSSNICRRHGHGKFNISQIASHLEVWKTQLLNINGWKNLDSLNAWTLRI